MAARSSSSALSWAPRMLRAPGAKALPLAAIRIPERLTAHLAAAFPSGSPRLYVHEGARQSLERRFTSAFPVPVVLHITDNRHSIVSHRRRGPVLHVRLHHMFLDAPPRVLEALVRYVAGGDREASLAVGRYIEVNGSRIVRRRPRAVRIETRGRHHDLRALFDAINERYFDGGVSALVTWGRRARRGTTAPRRTLTLGSYGAADRLVRIHPVLDRSWVPRYFVAYVLFHEMLHHVVPTGRTASWHRTGRRSLHSPEFLERERGFRHYERALAWERKHLARLLRVG